MVPFCLFWFIRGHCERKWNSFSVWLRLEYLQILSEHGIRLSLTYISVSIRRWWVFSLNLQIAFLINFKWITIIYHNPRYKWSYTSAHVLLNLFDTLGKRDKMSGLPSILSLLRNEFNKFNNTGAQMIDFIYHTTLWVLCNCILAYKAQEFAIYKWRCYDHQYLAVLNTCM